MRTYYKFLFAILLIISTYSCSEKKSTYEESDKISEMSYGVELDKFFSEIGEVSSGDFFTPLLMKLGASNDQIQQVLNASEKVFDVRKMKIGNSYEALYEKIPNEGDTTFTKGDITYFIYEKDQMSHIIFSLKDSIYVSVEEKDMEEKLRYSEVVISSSLWNDVKAIGANPLLALKLSDIYAWTIDFFGLAKGDSFKVLYNELSYEGEVIDIDKIYYVEFTSNNKLYYAIRFNDGDKGSQYWNEKGESLKKAFLKAPLSFVRISSKFTYARRHPVLKIVRPHTGVDYAAPKGTPVMSIGDGVVIQRGWAGGGGNTIKIKHNSIYTTSYMHLSKFASGLKKGQRVKQGEVIGYVGSTGLSTGPHLDFRVYKNGKPINPLTMESPSSEPISKSNKEAFISTMNVYRSQIDSLETEQYVNKIFETLKGN
jgi:Membrane proteins related to metalloendopeptidases